MSNKYFRGGVFMENVLDLKYLKSLIENEDVENLSNYMELHNLKLEGSKIVPKNRKEYEDQVSFWDQRQYVRKILLNS